MTGQVPVIGRDSSISQNGTGILSSDQVSQCIDALCQCGCDAVRATISAMESGAVVPQVEILSEIERERVLDELKAVMAVYDARE